MDKQRVQSCCSRTCFLIAYKHQPYQDRGILGTRGLKRLQNKCVFISIYLLN